MLVDGAKYGDVEIPVFCYEPKLGQPVGACRMCLVEIEGIPKLQTACSTPVKDGMVVHTQTERVHDAQRAVVEFLLINHPLDCPVCDKGGECPLQDITYGWGPGTSRFIEPKRHFRKPLELSPLIAIDRERCILCYRCVRFSQEISEDYQLILLERGAHSFVGTFDGHPYVAPFSGNITELCPVGALTSSAYRFRARPWDIEGAGSVCTLCPPQCNVELTVRDDRVMRVLARDHDEVDDGWLCDKGRYAYQHVHVDERITEPLVREGDELMPASWEKALAAAGGALEKAGGSAAALAGGETTNEEAFLLQRLFREGLGSGHLASRAGGELPLDVARALADPALQATVPDLEFAHTVLLLDSDPVDDAPILDLRIRKGVRRHGVRLAVASARPTALDPRADVVLRTAPGGGEALLVALDAALTGDEGDLGGAATAAGSQRRGRPRARRGAERGGRGHRDRLRRAAARGPRRRRRGARAAQRRHAARPRRPRGRRPARDPRQRERPRPARGRLRRRPRAGLRDARRARRRRDRDRPGPRRRRPPHALPPARRPAAHASRPRAVGAGAGHRAERDRPRVGDDGDRARVRRRRLPGRGLRREGGHARAPRRPRCSACAPRSAAPRAPRQGGGVRAGWQVIADVAARAGLDLGVVGRPDGLAAAVRGRPVLRGADARRDRRPRRALARARVRREARRRRRGSRSRWRSRAARARPRATKGALRLGTYRSLWSSKEVDVSPVLQFLRPQQVVELSPVDAERLGVADGDQVEVGSNGHARARPGAPARGGPGRLGVHRRGHARPAGQRADGRARRDRPRRRPRAAAGRASPSRSRPPARAAPRRRRRRRLEIPPTNGHSGHGA